jgi:DNA-binding MarR family transcriptional regulator
MVEIRRIVHLMSTVERDRTNMPATPVDRAALTTEMIAQLRLVLRELKCLGSQRLLRRGVSMSNLHVMSMLERHGALTMSRIAEALDVSLSNATGLVDRMEERGLVARVRDGEDRRVVHVGLTDSGRSVLSDIEVFQSDAVSTILRQLDERQLERLTTTLDDLRGAVARANEADPDLFAHNHQFHEPGTSRHPSPPRA